MLTDGMSLPGGLSMRPMRESDNAFFETLYRSTRDDLRLLDAEEDFIEEFIGFQRRAQVEGYGGQYPNAMYFVAEHHGDRIGRIVLDFGQEEVRVVDIALIPAARGKGFGGQILQVVQLIAGKLKASVSLSVRFDNLAAKQLYLGLGFVVEEAGVPFERMVWRPPAIRPYPGA